ncbi:hypothetical protein BJ944DRAFT_237632 [Cunninghamella echinulata]|nr:hypothetical protein BJ944DRAFT_237632 [Cunninghamella echinulata]
MKVDDEIVSVNEDIAAGQCVRFGSIQIIRVSEATIPDVRLEYIKQLVTSKPYFPLPHCIN